MMTDWLKELPWFYIWIGFLASLAFIFHWLVEIEKWLCKRRRLKESKDIIEKNNIRILNKIANGVIRFNQIPKKK